MLAIFKNTKASALKLNPMRVHCNLVIKIKTQTFSNLIFFRTWMISSVKSVRRVLKNKCIYTDTFTNTQETSGAIIAIW